MESQPQPIVEPRAPIGAGAGVGIAALLALLAAFVMPLEGMVLRTYADPVWGEALPTACGGDTGPHIRMGQTFTEEECLGMLARRHHALLQSLDRCVSVPVSAHVAVSVLSLADNVGATAVCRSTLVRRINAGQAPAEFCPEFSRWMYVGSRDCRLPESGCAGIVRRRAAERAVCEGRQP